ncbi:LacI family transcriptional regulator [Paenibacillus albiflavus]|uniref:LacI family transcriptional regulator n=1 Tax=Paenibacillus albiflavus TaxID=2545760 RepID=A0A4R4EHQ4_9BACL|nr:LacI family DNA-binding transcriptional regulator [Paenibacillus albiflavus]TCZ77705.1 LacI family transcriptional regulator [Paenibacillus albiflavus]
MSVSIYDVAKRSGLSVVTVSRVINQASSVRESNRQKVLQAMKELNYRPNSAARSLARGKTGTIGLVLATLQDSVFEGIVREVNEQLEELGYFLALSIDHSFNSKLNRVSNYLFQKDRVDGIILLSSIHEVEYIQELRSKKIPFVLIDNHDLSVKATMIRVDNYAGGALAAQHLLDLGHRDIGLIYGPQHLLSARERKQGFEQVLADNGITPVISTEAEFEIGDGFRVAQNWIKQGVHLTAIATADDFMAWGVIQAYHEAGLRVPHDMSVIGYDDQDFACDVHPSLTTVRQPTESIGREAVKRLAAMLNQDLEVGKSEVEGQATTQGLYHERQELIKFQPQLLVRSSTSSII